MKFIIIISDNNETLNIGYDIFLKNENSKIIICSNFINIIKSNLIERGLSKENILTTFNSLNILESIIFVYKILSSYQNLDPDIIFCTDKKTIKRTHLIAKTIFKNNKNMKFFYWQHQIISEEDEIKEANLYYDFYLKYY
jgi:hypothetical protein